MNMTDIRNDSAKIVAQLAAEPNNNISKIFSFVVVIAFLIWSMSTIEYKGIQENGVEIAKNIFRGIFTPDSKLLFTLTKQGVPFLILETISIAFLGTIIGAVLAFPLAFLASSNIVPRYISTITSFVIAAIRTFPAFVYGLMFIRVTGPGPFAGVLTLSLVSIGMISKLYIEAIQDLDKGIIEALDAAGCNGFEKIRYGVLPQLSSNFISTVIYRFEINIKNAAVLGLVGAGGIGAPLIFAMSAYRWSEVGAILVGLIVIVLIVEFYSSKIRNKLARG